MSDGGQHAAGCYQASATVDRQGMHDQRFGQGMRSHIHPAQVDPLNNAKHDKAVMVESHTSASAYRHHIGGDSADSWPTQNRHALELYVRQTCTN
jgi:hypothetical protein